MSAWLRLLPLTRPSDAQIVISGVRRELVASAIAKSTDKSSRSHRRIRWTTISKHNDVIAVNDFEQWWWCYG